MLSIKKITTAVVAAGLGLALLSGCRPDLHEAVITVRDGYYTIQALPCGSASIKGVYVTIPGKQGITNDQDDYTGSTIIWTALGEGNFSSKSVTLFTENAGFATVQEKAIPADAELMFTVGMPEYSDTKQITGRLSDLTEGYALTSQGIILIQSVDNGKCVL